MNTPTKLTLVVAFLLYASVFQLLMANEEAKSSDEFNILQLPVSKEVVSEPLDEVVLAITTRYDESHLRKARKVGICFLPKHCKNDSDCIGSECGSKCSPGFPPYVAGSFCTSW